MSFTRLLNLFLGIFVIIYISGCAYPSKVEQDTPLPKDGQINTKEDVIYQPCKDPLVDAMNRLYDGQPLLSTEEKNGYIAEITHRCETNQNVFQKLLETASSDNNNLIEDIFTHITYFPYLISYENDLFRFYFLSSLGNDVTFDEKQDDTHKTITLSIKNNKYDAQEEMVEIYDYTGSIFSMIDYIQKMKGLSGRYCAYITDGTSYFTFTPRDTSTVFNFIDDTETDAEKETARCTTEGYAGGGGMTYKVQSYYSGNITQTYLIGIRGFGNIGGGIPPFIYLRHEQVYHE